MRGDLPFGERFAFAEHAASCQSWGLLKRPDEKYVTAYADDHPKFVEDLVRDVAVASENFESIHNHSAWAWLEGRNP